MLVKNYNTFPHHTMITISHNDNTFPHYTMITISHNDNNKFLLVILFFITNKTCPGVYHDECSTTVNLSRCIS